VPVEDVVVDAASIVDKTYGELSVSDTSGFATLM
jgi:hypothetical protein